MLSEPDSTRHGVGTTLNDGPAHVFDPIARYAYVIVCEQDHFPTCLGKTAISGVTLPSARLVYVSYEHVFEFGILDDVARMIGGTVVDHQQLRRQVRRYLATCD
jgi:hypothetical protein